jgi:hypothetical protein
LKNGKIIENINNNNTEYLVEFHDNNEKKQLKLNYYDIYSDKEIKTDSGNNYNCVESCVNSNTLSVKYYNEDGVLQECSINYDNVTGIKSL